MEEFQEADVLWPDAGAAHHQQDGCHRLRHCHHDTITAREPHAAARRAEQLMQSAPVRIPATTMTAEARSYYDDDEGGGGRVVRRASSSGAEAAAGIVPPHVLAARRCAEERRVVASSSVCVGHGRTLKGRDLRAVRNAVLHMTGFLSSSDKY